MAERISDETPDPRAVALAARLRSDLGPEIVAALALRLRDEPAAVVEAALRELAPRPAGPSCYKQRRHQVCVK